jgi:hypothetical protein
MIFHVQHYSGEVPRNPSRSLQLLKSAITLVENLLAQGQCSVVESFRQLSGDGR